MANGEKKLLGTKNMLDHFKNCSPSSCNDSSAASDSCSGSSVVSGSDDMWLQSSKKNFYHEDTRQLCEVCWEEDR